MNRVIKNLHICTDTRNMHIVGFLLLHQNYSFLVSVNKSIVIADFVKYYTQLTQTSSRVDKEVLLIERSSVLSRGHTTDACRLHFTIVCRLRASLVWLGFRSSLVTEVFWFRLTSLAHSTSTRVQESGEAYTLLSSTSE